MQLFDRIKSDPNYNSRNSYTWFQEKIKLLFGGDKISSMRMLELNQNSLTTQILPGKMYLFSYSPKYKETLPYYDTFPLIIPFSMDAKHFTGINFHYLKPYVRIILLNKLMQFAVHYKSDSAIYTNPARTSAIYANPARQQASTIIPNPARIVRPLSGPESIAQLRFSWNLVSNFATFPEVQPAVKMYLKGYVKSRFINISPDDWASAIMLPCENFKKETASNVWKASKAMMNK